MKRAFTTYNSCDIIYNDGEKGFLDFFEVEDKGKVTEKVKAKRGENNNAERKSNT